MLKLPAAAPFFLTSARHARCIPFGCIPWFPQILKFPELFIQDSSNGAFRLVCGLPTSFLDAPRHTEML